MDESIVRALVIGATFAVIGIAANLVWRLVRTPNGAARRLAGLCVAALLVIGFITGNAEERMFLALVTLAGVGVWIMRGPKKS